MHYEVVHLEAPTDERPKGCVTVKLVLDMTEYGSLLDSAKEVGLRPEELVSGFLNNDLGEQPGFSL